MTDKKRGTVATDVERRGARGKVAVTHLLQPRNIYDKMSSRRGKSRHPSHPIRLSSLDTGHMSLPNFALDTVLPPQPVFLFLFIIIIILFR